MEAVRTVPSTSQTDSTATINEDNDIELASGASIQDEKLIGEWSAANKMAGSFMGDMVITANSVDFTRMGKFQVDFEDEAQLVLKTDPATYKGQISDIKYYKFSNLKKANNTYRDDVDYEMTVSLYKTLEALNNGQPEQEGLFWKYGIADAINDFSFGDGGYIYVIAKDGKKVGVGAGESIAELKKAGVLKEDVLETGEGSFDVLNIMDKNHGALGYVMEDDDKKGTIRHYDYYF